MTVEEARGILGRWPSRKVREAGRTLDRHVQDMETSLREAIDIAGGEDSARGVQSLTPIDGQQARELRRALVAALPAREKGEGQT